MRGSVYLEGPLLLLRSLSTRGASADAQLCASGLWWGDVQRWQLAGAQVRLADSSAVVASNTTASSSSASSSLSSSSLPSALPPSSSSSSSASSSAAASSNSSELSLDAFAAADCAAFHVLLPTGSVLRLAARSESDRARWVTALLAAAEAQTAPQLLRLAWSHCRGGIIRFNASPNAAHALAVPNVSVLRVFPSGMLELLCSSQSPCQSCAASAGASSSSTSLSSCSGVSSRGLWDGQRCVLGDVFLGSWDGLGCHAPPSVVSSLSSEGHIPARQLWLEPSNTWLPCGLRFRNGSMCSESDEALTVVHGSVPAPLVLLLTLYYRPRMWKT